MKKYENFWVVTIFRGVLAVLIGAAILVVPDMTRTLLLLPVGVAFAVISLAFYGVADSLLVFLDPLRPYSAALVPLSDCAAGVFGGFLGVPGGAAHV
jgi:uncharacterized membrane protein YfcA